MSSSLPSTRHKAMSEVSSLTIPIGKFYTSSHLQIKRVPQKGDHKKKVVLVLFILYAVILPFFIIADIGLDMYACRVKRTKRATRLESHPLPSKNLMGKVTSDRSSEYGIIQDAISGSHLSSSEYEDVTWVSHGTVHHLGRVPALASAWQGPLSISLFLGSVKDVEPTKKAIECLRTQHPILELSTTFSFVFSFDDQNEPIWRFWNGSCDSVSEFLDARNASLSRTKVLYPINIMRNVARNSSRTHFFAVCDLDIAPNPGLRNGFREMMKKNKSLAKENAIYIMPSFELQAGTPKPKNKTELRLLYEEGIARQFFFTWSPLAQGSTDYARWFNLPPSDEVEISYEVEWGFLYEPLFIAPSSAPYYYEKIKGYAYEQGIHACELSVRDWKFYVLDNAFITHDGLKLFEQSPFLDRTVRQRLWKSVSSLRIYRSRLLSQFGSKARQCSSLLYRATEVVLMIAVQVSR